jgi:soluble lytic murein transglycosylase
MLYARSSALLVAVLVNILVNIMSAQAFGATAESEAPSRFDQRRQYQDAIHFISSGQRTKYLRLKDKLRTYPLFPYLEYTDRIHRIAYQTPDEIRAFVEQHADTPLAERLRQNYVYSEGKRGRWANFLAFFDPDNTTDLSACFYPYALAKQGREDQAMAEARKLWLVPFSQPDECDASFDLWLDAGHPDGATAWQRYAMSMKDNEVTLANYLMRFVDPDDRQFAAQLKLVHTRPENITRTSRFKSTHPLSQEVILHGIQRFARRDPGLAFELLQDYAGQQEFDRDALNDTWAYIGHRLAGIDDGKYLSALPLELRDYPDLIEAMIRHAIGRNRPGDILVLIHLLPAEAQQTSRWRYWKATVLAGSEGQADQAMGQQIFTELSKERSFYGFMSADRLGVNYHFEYQPAAISNDEILSLELTPGIQRALEFFTLGDYTSARREWYFTTRDFSTRELAIAARVAARWGWYKPAIQSLIDAEAWDDLAVRFPVAFRETFLRNARGADIPVNWSLAVARQESAFMADARSSAGALGLMQLMPKTAELTAQYAGFRLSSSSQLTDPQVNILLGSHYLGQMLRRFDNNRVLATAAYNAGPGRVDRWRNDGLSADAWIETIPFAETRQYVQNVLTFAAIYSWQMDLQQPLIYAHEHQKFAPPAPPSQTLSASATDTLPDETM